MRRQDGRRLLALLSAPDVERERRQANERFARRPPQNLEEELAWQREVQLRAEANRVRAAVQARRPREIERILLKRAYRQAVKTLGRERLVALLGKPLNPRKGRFTRREARELRSLLGLDSPWSRDVSCSQDGTG